MERKITIDYYWRCEKFPKGIPKELEEELEEAAMERITSMVGEGYVSGELSADIRVDVPGKRTPADGWECSGWWNVTKS